MNEVDSQSGSGAMALPITVVYIEDDAKLARLTAQYLESFGMRVIVELEARSGIASVLRERPDVILLDLMLPESDGLEVCKQLRARLATPIVMVTAHGEEADRVMGLEGGADDYISKPFSPRELLARVRAQARRGRGQVGPRSHLVVGPLSIEPTSRSVTLDGRELELTSYEFDLLRALAERAGQVLSREQLVEIVRGSADEAFDRSIDVRISRLRQKLGDDPRHSRLLKTVRGVGYVLVAGRP
ncbi:Phosphate regulon transcriptional regulatory protein PhoB (SphR) [Labilithrix luteola]|uniref:Phosphate regulon transcriptional regulatory protein PhoB (SphR) n=1 Tax=Labilithrix luteola TaxID=1391654 RepID=A0A0K1Q4W6_9BACT|nr:response regulator transcription factor [Labilithrix luteola]AKV00450.1 Phosphate regulon transcriptional regulatory protein PhoB (SphR) [Labilithrix luteola]